jgi:hypothetical protein
MTEHDDGRTQTLGLLEEMRRVCRELQGDLELASRRLTRLNASVANPNLPDVENSLTFRVEKWDRHDQHVTWLVSLNSTVTVALAAYEAAVRMYPDDRWTLRQGIHVIRQHVPENLRSE